MSTPTQEIPAVGAEHLLVEDRPIGDGVARILTLCRPARRNALSTALIDDLISALAAADADPTVRAVILTGRGAIFCAGGDLKEFVGLDDARDRMAARARLLTRLLTLPPTMSTPVVAAVNGAALGAGAALALTCDLIVAGDDLVLGYPEITDSVVPAVVMAGAVHHTSPKLAFEMLTQGRRLDAQEALRRDLVTTVAAPELTLDTALDQVAVWGRIDPATVGETKRLFYRISELPHEAGIQAGLKVTTATWTPEH